MTGHDERGPEAGRTGGCLCGAVRYRLAEAPAGFEACHCGMCRRWSGGVELAVQAKPGGVQFEGADNIRIYASSDWAERAFCGVCGSSLYWRMTAPGESHGTMAISAGTLDSLDGLSLVSEIYIDHKPDGYAFAGERSRMTEAEVLAMFGVDGPPPA